jgi:tetratricopeptide (TPR) repeat protein
MSSDISKRVLEIMSREVGDAAKSLISRQCNQLGIDSENIGAEDLPMLAGRLSELMRVMGGHQKANRLYQELKKLADLDRIAELARSDDSRMAMFDDLARASLYSGEWDRAIFYFKKLLHNAEVRKDRSGTAKYLVWIGFVHKERSDPVGAMGYYERALRFAEASADKNQLSTCYFRMGDVLWQGGDLDRALASYRMAIDHAADGQSKGAANIGIGNVLMSRRDFEGAMRHYAEALALLEGTDDYLDLARAHNNIGDVHMQLGKLDAAIESFKRSGEFAEKGGWLNIMAYTQFNEANARVGKGDLEVAGVLLDRSMATLKMIDSKAGIAGAARAYGRLYGASGDAGAMESSYRVAIEHYRLAKNPFYEAECLLELGEGYMGAGSVEKARECLQESARIFGQLNLADMAEKAAAAMRGKRAP